MKKEHVSKILENIAQDSVFYEKAQEALRILAEDKDYTIQYSRKGIKNDTEVETMERWIKSANPPHEKGGIYDALDLVKREKGLVNHLMLFPKKHWIYIVLNREYKMLRLEIEENRPFDIGTGYYLMDHEL